jgi:hypothetical protein
MQMITVQSHQKQAKGIAMPERKPPVLSKHPTRGERNSRIVIRAKQPQDSLEMTSSHFISQKLYRFRRFGPLGAC